MPTQNDDFFKSVEEYEESTPMRKTYNHPLPAKTKTIINACISLFEVIGGLASIVITAFLFFPSIFPQLSGNFPINIKIFLIFIIIFVLLIYLLDITGGILLWKNKKSGYILSIIAQSFQIPVFALAGLYYSIASGIYLTGFISTSSISDAWRAAFNLGIGGFWKIYYTPGDYTFMVGINIIALIIFSYLIIDYPKKDKR